MTHRQMFLVAMIAIGFVADVYSAIATERASTRKEAMPWVLFGLLGVFLFFTALICYR